MSEIRKTLDSLASQIEAIENWEPPKPDIKDRELSGNKIHGGKITKFSSVGIEDEAKTQILKVTENGIVVKNITVDSIDKDLEIKGDLSVNGEIYATKLHVDEISADIRNERTSPLEFKGKDRPAFGKGLIWSAKDYTRQFILRDEPSRMFSTEDIDVGKDKSYKVNNKTVISENALGNTVQDSNLKKLGKLKTLSVIGTVNFSDTLFWLPETEQLSIGTEDPNGIFSLSSNQQEFVIDSQSGHWKIGTWTTSSFDIITDDTARISIENTGKITVNSKTSFMSSVGIGVKNYQTDVDLTVAGPVRFQNKKQEVGETAPSTGIHSAGDIVWNSFPRPTGYVGWICVREGSPGEWKPFGQISA